MLACCLGIPTSVGLADSLDVETLRRLAHHSSVPLQRSRWKISPTGWGMLTQHIHFHYKEWKYGETEWERWKYSCEFRYELNAWCFTSLGRRRDIPISQFSAVSAGAIKTNPSTYETLANPQGHCSSLFTQSHGHLVWDRTFPRRTHSHTYAQLDLYLLIFHSCFQMACIVLACMSFTVQLLYFRTGFTVNC